MLLRGGRYETIGKIAAGGMAKVLLGRAVGVGGFERLVAIKAMHEHLSCEPEFVAMFLDEARLAARIHHPNVVSTLDVDEDEEGIFIVMEYVDGPALSALQRALRKDGRTLPTDVMLRIFLDALAGLHAAHELTGPGGELLRLVHRDVSPANILLGLDGIARLTDFGVAHAESRRTTTVAGQIKGKLAYMAPEQLDHHPVDRRADVYSAGVVLWELCTGQRMLTSDNDAGMITEVLRGRRRSPREVIPDIPATLEAACMRALEPLPADRFPTAAAFAEALEASGLPIAATRVVAAFLNEMGIRPQQHSLPPSSTSSVRTASRSGAAASSFAQVETSPPSSGAPAAPMIPSTQPTSASASFSVPERRRGRGMIAAGVGAVALAGAAAFVLLRFGPGKPEGVAGAAMPVAASPSAAAMPAAPAAAETAPATEETGAPLAPSPLLDAGGSPLRSFRHDGDHDPRTRAAKPADKQPPASSTSFRPAEL